MRDEFVQLFNPVCDMKRELRVGEGRCPECGDSVPSPFGLCALCRAKTANAGNQTRETQPVHPCGCPTDGAHKFSCSLAGRLAPPIDADDEKIVDALVAAHTPKGRSMRVPEPLTDAQLAILEKCGGSDTIALVREVREARARIAALDDIYQRTSAEVERLRAALDEVAPIVKELDDALSTASSEASYAFNVWAKLRHDKARAWMAATPKRAHGTNR